MRKNNIYAVILCLSILLGAAAPAHAAGTSERDLAVKYLTDRSIYQGDAHGNLNLDSSLTRAELAAILARVNGDEKTVKADIEEFTLNCYFSDVPEWAKPYVGYCARKCLMNGYSMSRFGPDDPVSPKMACTVMLRYLGFAETDWTYDTSIQKARTIGITPDQGLGGQTITRVDMAVVIYRAMTYDPKAVIGQTVADGSGLVSTVPLTTKVLDGSNMAREDFSQQANPAVFDDVYTRAAYNAIRQSIVDRDIILAQNNSDGFNIYYNYASTCATAETRSAMVNVLFGVGTYYRYSDNAEPYLSNYYTYPDYFIVTPSLPAVYTEANAATEELPRQISLFSCDADKVRWLNDYLCDRMIYESKSFANPNEVFTSNVPIKGQCSTFADIFKYLCDRADIPCYIISGENHVWNIVFADGAWLYVDVSVNVQIPSHSALLLSPTCWKEDGDPKGTAFAKEVLVPSSTR